MYKIILEYQIKEKEIELQSFKTKEEGERVLFHLKSDWHNKPYVVFPANQKTYSIYLSNIITDIRIEEN